MKIKRGHLYIADLNPRYGTEAGKNRPIVVIQNDWLNDLGLPSTWVLPCTTQLKPENMLRVRLPQGAAGNLQECDVMVDQSRAIDNQRIKKMLGPVPASLFEEIIEKLKLAGNL